ncbi:sugar ABC transporter permease [Cohnella sp. CIP 111063]|jgi:multiple sugar transport system permease protein|uniref:carbohydrate ABC transporter permease n=1 Tax=unclassified Cohnella TaxID=2636738 RepID=UPI000B8BFB5E|nr:MULTISPECIES: carbohydrate ABC transporter permease [unclassified Cohnella]OXS53066.1 sugar ABC transporter permease [Cohnella sp. CIP 111063]PRX60572.1 carbohydrate ABC transporter membrane protein 2 (CUT1 family) [Cohnella sp. SGD-V74]
MKWFYRIVSVVMAAIFLLPVIWMLVVSIKEEGMKIVTVVDWFTPPYSLAVYDQILNGTKLTDWLLNSVLVAVFVTLLTVVVAAMAGFVLSKVPFRYRAVAFFFILSGLLIPGEAIIIPLYQVAKDMNLLNSYEGLIIPVLASPVAVIVLKSFFDGVPNDLLESVQIDGGGTWRIFTSIMIPLIRPALASMAILTFIGSWNNFLWPFLSITDDNLFTLPMGIPTLMSQYSEDYVKPMVVNTIASLPIMLLFIIFERQIVKGVSLSGIKG